MIIDNPMKNSPLTITLYDRAPLTKERNGIIDNLNVLLSSHNAWIIKTETSTNPFELSMRQFKLNASDSNAFITTANIQYMRISWANRYNAFYWVNKITRGSNDVILLDIELDVLNTIHNGDDQATSPLLSFSPLSSIEREHCNRFVEFELQEGTNRVPTIIDKVSEGANAVMYRIPTSEIVEPLILNPLAYALDSHNWYLVYARGTNSKITCFLIPDTSSDIKLYDPTSSQWVQSIDMSSLDRSDSTITKIIRCPYCPINLVSKSGNNWTFDNRFKVVVRDYSLTGNRATLEIDLTDTTTNLEQLQPFKRRLENYAHTSYTDFAINISYTTQLAALGETRHVRDPKLYNSEFYGIYFVYDSSVWQFKPELYEGDTSLVSFDIKYCQSSSIDSALTFTFLIDNYVSDDYYNCLLTSRRQNEVVVYSDDYMNYIRNGYNYDIAKQTLNNFISIGSSAVALGVSVASANPIGIVGSSLALSKSIAHAGTSEIDRQKNLRTMAQSSFNVSGVNDSSLFEDYGEGKLKCVLLQPSELEQKRWSDIFYYYGYNRAGVQGIPNVTSRIWFNFLKGEIILNDANKIPVWLYEKVKDAFRSGVTYFHCHQISLFPSLYQWNLEQTRENYETFLLNL